MQDLIPEKQEQTKQQTKPPLATTQTNRNLSLKPCFIISGIGESPLLRFVNHRVRLPCRPNNGVVEPFQWADLMTQHFPINRLMVQHFPINYGWRLSNPLIDDFPIQWLCLCGCKFDDATLSNRPIDDATLSNQLWIEDFPIHGLRCKAKLSNQRIEDPKWIPNRIIIDWRLCIPM